MNGLKDFRWTRNSEFSGNFYEIPQRVSDAPGQQRPFQFNSVPSDFRLLGAGSIAATPPTARPGRLGFGAPRVGRQAWKTFVTMKNSEKTDVCLRLGLPVHCNDNLWNHQRQTFCTDMSSVCAFVDDGFHRPNAKHVDFHDLGGFRISQLAFDSFDFPSKCLRSFSKVASRSYETITEFFKRQFEQSLGYLKENLKSFRCGPTR